jgi:Glyoxalase-like domain
MSTKWTATVDCAHPAALAAFWRLALGYVEASPPEGFTSWAQWLTHAVFRRRSGTTVLT